MSPFKKITTALVILVFCLLLSSLALPSWGGEIAQTKSEMSPVVVASSVSFTFPWKRGSSAGADETSSTAVAEPVSTPELTPSPTPSPISVLGVSYPWDTKSLTLKLKSADVSSVLSSLSSFPHLTHLTIPEDSTDPSSFTAADFITLSKALPLTEIDCTFDLYGQRLNTVSTTRLEYLQIPIGDLGLDIFWKLLPYLHHLSYLSFDRCDTTDEACANLRDAFPDTEVVWRIFFSPFSCMTDVETIWASVDLRDETCSSLKYCTKVKNLDIGHSAMTDLSFLDYMPDLEVLIIACSDFEDISHVASCKNLKYLEVCECFRLKDLSPIAELKNLEHLNVGDLMVSDISCLHSLTECKNLKRFYAPNMRNYELDMEKEEKIFRTLLPGVEMDFSKTYMGLGSLNGHWRYVEGFNGGTFTEPYRHIREIFRYEDGIMSQPRLLF